MTTEEHQQIATKLFEQKKFTEALKEFSKAIQAGETSDVWNDWAVAQLACGNAAEAENGFRRALTQDSKNSTAATNLVALLSNMGRSLEAMPFVEVAASDLPAKERNGLARLVETIKATQQSQPRTSSASKTSK